MADIVLNVNRSRINVLALVLTLYVFTIGLLAAQGGRLDLPPAWVFLESIVTIVLGFTVTIAALVFLLVGQRLDERGRSNIYTFAAGDLLTYLALAMAISGCLRHFISAIANVLYTIPASALTDPALAPQMHETLQALGFWLLAFCGGAWFLLVYALPALLFYRLPVPGWHRVALAAGYVTLLIVIAWISAYPARIKADARGAPEAPVRAFAAQLVQPLTWTTAPSRTPED